MLLIFQDSRQKEKNGAHQEYHWKANRFAYKIPKYDWKSTANDFQNRFVFTQLITSFEKHRKKV